MGLVNLDRCVAVMNGKGGVGKTSIVANVGALAAAAGYRVLLVDLDPQGNLGEDLGYTGTDTDDEGRALLTAVASGQPAAVSGAVRDRLDVIAGGVHTEELEGVLGLRRQRNAGAALDAVRAVLEPLSADYDLILLDCPPGGASLQDAALGASRWLIIPSKTDASSRKGMRTIARRFVDAKNAGASVDLLGVVLFGVSSSATSVREQARTDLVTDLGGVAPVFASVIRHSEASARAARRDGRVCFELEVAAANQPAWWERLRTPTIDLREVPASVTGLAGDYQRLAEEILSSIATTEQEVTV
jgi:cellulose biosynthesis protein BcsQ